MQQTYSDSLTDCYNRRFLPYWVDNEIKRSKRFTTKFGLILLDIDDFRDINNAYGHSEGDKVLLGFAQFIHQNIRKIDSLVRYGGDEFVILVPNTTTKGTTDLAHRIYDNLQTVEIAHHKITCSIGFAIFPDNGTTVDALISYADDLMYQAKKQGKNRIALKKEIVKKLRIPSPKIVGREADVQWCLHQLKEYDTIFIGGEAGIGKTRLLLELPGQLKNCFILNGKAFAALSCVPYHLFKKMFQELMERNAALVQRILNQMPVVYQEEVVKLLPAEQMARVAKTTELDKYRLYRAASTFIHNIADSMSSTPIVFLMDDVHWMDRPSCEFFDFFIRSLSSPIKVFGTYRTEEIRRSEFSYFSRIWTRENFSTHTTLSPLDEAQTTHLLKIMMGMVPRKVATFVYRQSGGNPFYIEEILRELDQKKKIYWNGKEWVFVKDLAVAIPSSITETIKRKLKFLDPEIRQFLEIAAVYGQEFMPEIIAMASKRNVGQILDALDELRRLGFIKERTSDVFFFSEDVVRQIVYKSMSKSDLLQYHKLVGEAIENFYQGSLTIYLEQLANHFTIANDSQKALLYSKQAALKAKENYAHTLAIKFFDNALKYEDNPDEIFKIRFALAETFFLAGDYKKAIQEFNRCCRINPHAYRVYDKFGKVYENVGNFKKSLKYYMLGLRETQEMEVAYAFKIAIAWVYTRLGQYLRAQKECEKILKKKERLKKRYSGNTYIVLGSVFLNLEKFDKAESCFKESLKLIRAVGDKNLIATCYLHLALTNQRKSNTEAAIKFYEKVLNLYEEIGYQNGIVKTLLDLGTLYTDHNQPKAEECLERALSIAQLIGAKRDMVYLYSNLGTVSYNQLKNDRALFNFKKALACAEKTNFTVGVILSNLDLSGFYREKGAVRRGKMHLTSARYIAEKMNLKYYIFWCILEEIEYLLRSKSYKKANRLSEKLLSQLRSEQNIIFKIYGLLYRARTVMALRNHAKAHVYYKQAYNLITSQSLHRVAGEVCYYWGVTYRDEKKFKEARKKFVEAQKIFEDIGNIRYVEKVKKELAEKNGVRCCLFCVFFSRFDIERFEVIATVKSQDLTPLSSYLSNISFSILLDSLYCN